MSNIERLKREATAARVTGWHYGSDTLPLRQDDPTTLQADDLRAVNVCPHGAPECKRFCAMPSVCGCEP